jgi:hypothetical protein
MAEPWTILWTPMTGVVSGWDATFNGKPIGWVIHRQKGDYHWRIYAVDTKHICKGFGDAVRPATAKRALELNWKRWLDYYGLEKK